MARQRMSCFLGVLFVIQVAACGDPEIVVPDVLSVTILPPHGSVDISVNVVGLVYFSHPVASSAGVTEKVSLECQGAPSPNCSSPDSVCGTPPTVTVEFQPGDMEARITTSPSLETNKCYVVTVTKGIESTEKNVGPLPGDRRSAFQTQ